MSLIEELKMGNAVTLEMIYDEVKQVNKKVEPH